MGMISRATWDILQEFDWNVESLANEIINLRDTLKLSEKEVEKLLENR